MVQAIIRRESIWKLSFVNRDYLRLSVAITAHPLPANVSGDLADYLSGLSSKGLFQSELKKAVPKRTLGMSVGLGH